MKSAINRDLLFFFWLDQHANEKQRHSHDNWALERKRRNIKASRPGWEKTVSFNSQNKPRYAAPDHIRILICPKHSGMWPLRYLHRCVCVRISKQACGKDETGPLCIVSICVPPNRSLRSSGGGQIPCDRWAMTSLKQDFSLITLLLSSDPHSGIISNNALILSGLSTDVYNQICEVLFIHSSTMQSVSVWEDTKFQCLQVDGPVTSVEIAFLKWEVEVGGWRLVVNLLCGGGFSKFNLGKMKIFRIFE